MILICKENNYLKSRYRCNNTCFTGKDLLSMTKEQVLSEIKKSVNNRRQLIGSGSGAQVYRIGDTSYCVKIPDGEETDYTNRFDKNIDKSDEINHVVIKLGGGATVMRYYPGQTLFTYQLHDSSRYKLQKEVSQMPIKAYSSLLHQISNAMDNEMIFDRGAGNIIIDTKNQQLTMIDFNKAREYAIPTKPLKDIYSCLTSYGAESETAKQIAYKITLAGIEEFKPGKIPCMDIELFDFNDIIKATWYLNKNISGKSLNNLIKIFEDLKAIKNKEITDKSYSTELAEQIDIAKDSITEYYLSQ